MTALASLFHYPDLPLIFIGLAGTICVVLLSLRLGVDGRTRVKIEFMEGGRVP